MVKLLCYCTREANYINGKYTRRQILMYLTHDERELINQVAYSIIKDGIILFNLSVSRSVLVGGDGQQAIMQTGQNNTNQFLNYLIYI